MTRPPSGSELARARAWANGRSEKAEDSRRELFRSGFAALSVAQTTDPPDAAGSERDQPRHPPRPRLLVCRAGAALSRSPEGAFGLSTRAVAEIPSVVST
jgi:hypothetical protein